MGGELSAEVITSGPPAPPPGYPAVCHPGHSSWGQPVEDLTPPWCWTVTLMRQCTPCSPDTPLVLFFCPECELGAWADREAGLEGNVMSGGHLRE